jgi:hypothetical protein
MKIKTSDLTGRALDWAVELANGTHWSQNGYFVFDAPASPMDPARSAKQRYYDPNPQWRYSTDWAQGGLIIDREDIAVGPAKMCNAYRVIPGQPCRAYKITGPLAGNSAGDHYGPTRLIAAMRCHVASRLGYEVDVPDSLLQ